MTVHSFRRLQAFATVSVAIVACLAVAACSTFEQLTTGSIETKPPETTATATLPLATISVKPIVGASGPISDQLMRQLNQAAVRQNIALLVDQDARSQHTLQGYVTLVRDKNGAKISYIWDVTDAAGQRLNRVTGEEVVAGPAPPAGADKWATVTPTETLSIAEKAIASANASIKR
jgi:hypothetical protein